MQKNLPEIEENPDGLHRLPEIEENPDGLHQRYVVRTIDGETDPNAEYFVFRIDGGDSDPKHIAAGRHALLVYAALIFEHLPKLSTQLDLRIKQYIAEDGIKVGDPEAACWMADPRGKYESD